MRLPDKWTLPLERYTPWGVSLVVLVASVLLKHKQKLSIASELASPLLNILAIIVGFVAAVVTFLLTAQGLASLEDLRRRPQFKWLIDYHWAAVFHGFIAAVVSLAILPACKWVPYPYVSWIFHVWVFWSALALAAFLRVFWLLRDVLAPTQVDLGNPPPLPELPELPQPPSASQG